MICAYAGLTPLGNWDEHSGEFNWSIQQLNSFYQTLLNRLQ